MHRFSSGQFEGLTIEQAMLRDAPALYGIVEWARDKDIEGLRSMIRDFDVLRGKLLHARINAICAKTGCNLPVRSMTLPLDREGWNRPRPYYWCNAHEPLERSGVSPKQAVHFDATKHIKTKHQKDVMFKKLRLAFGIKSGTQITEQFAQDFFDALG